ncbi:MAG: radical SAM protein, partial [Nitrososphaera sp.]
GSDLPELLQACCSIEGSFRIRVGMMNPMYLPGMLNRLADLFRQNDKLYKFLHLPVESGSDKILRKMKRGHTSKIFQEAVKIIRKRIPEMTISTDVIVGFPSETEEDFDATLRVISDSEPDTVNISRYGARPGTESAGWKEQRVISQVAKARSERLHALAKEIATKRNTIWQGWEGEVTIDEIRKGTPQGRNYAYKPVMLPGNTQISIGDSKRVKVFDFSNFSLKARAIL